MTTMRVAWVGMIPCCKPGSHEPYRVMAAKAIKLAFTDAGLDAKSIG
jgi:sterol carrier protein 2